MKIIIYTAIFGDYDELLPPRKYNDDVKYLCICDEKQDADVWEYKIIKPKFMSLRRENRYWKINSHKTLKDYDYDISIYIDGRYEIWKDISKYAKKWLGNKPMALQKHGRHKCAYRQAKVYIRQGASVAGVAKKQIRKYRKEGFPKNFGMSSNFLIVRKNNDEVKDFNKIWWKEVKNNSVRDQISFSYAVWKTGIKWSKIPIKNQFYSNKNLEKDEIYIMKRPHKIDYEEGQRKVLIDCGSYKGNSLKNLSKKYPNFEKYAFEAIPKYYKKTKKSNPNTKVFNRAVWTHNKMKKMFIGRSEGSSLYSGKKSNQIGKHGNIKVKCIDFARWIKKKFNKNDFIVLKMDIEGAEYCVLNKMIRRGTINYIDVLYCEWHHQRISSISKRRHNNIIKSLKKKKLKIFEWG